MTYYPDLSPCAYFDRNASIPESRAERLVAVGWLDSDHSFPTGELPGELVNKLVDLVSDPWEPTHYFGYHKCEFCPEARETWPTEVSYSDKTVWVGACNLFVPGDGRVFVAPTMIAHYVVRHGYLPPAVFCDALKACPRMSSKEYTRAIMRNGPQDFKWAEYPAGQSHWRLAVLRLMEMKWFRHHFMDSRLFRRIWNL